MLVTPVRATCYRCHKPELTCICAQVPRVDNRTQIWLLQHKRERFHPIGTARIAKLGLARFRCDIYYGSPLTPPGPMPEGTGILYPGPGARPLEQLQGHELPHTLVVLDGTWHHAKTLYRDNPWLHRLPRFALRPETESRYRIRREPSAECLSTIEAVVQALQILEPDTVGLDGLIAAFDAMIDRQIRVATKRRDARLRAERES